MERLGDNADADSLIADVGAAAIQAGTGRPREAMKALWSTMQKIDPEKRGAVMNEARKVLFNPDAEAVRAFVARVDASGLKEGTRRQVLSTVQRALPRAATSAMVGQ